MISREACLLGSVAALMALVIASSGCGSRDSTDLGADMACPPDRFNSGVACSESQRHQICHFADGTNCYCDGGQWRCGDCPDDVLQRGFKGDFTGGSCPPDRSCSEDFFEWTFYCSCVGSTFACCKQSSPDPDDGACFCDSHPSFIGCG